MKRLCVVVDDKCLELEPIGWQYWNGLCWVYADPPDETEDITLFRQLYICKETKANVS